MADEPQTIRGINWREAFPFTHLFRTFRVAIHPSKLVLGLIALVALYIGGRVLDGIWSSHSLAVPGEVDEYERVVTSGGTGDQFVAECARKRDAVETEYADRLVAYGVTSDRTTANQAAAHSADLGELRGKIIEALQLHVREAQREYDEALTVAKNIGDPLLRDRMIRNADEAYRTAVRGLYADNDNIIRGAEEINGIGIFDSLFKYEARRINEVIDGVRDWNWLGTSRDERGSGVIDSAVNFFRIAPLWLMRYHPVYFVLFTLWFLTIWAIFGGAIARIAAIHVARDEKLSVRARWRSRWASSSASSPLR